MIQYKSGNGWIPVLRILAMAVAARAVLPNAERVLLLLLLALLLLGG